MVTTRVLHYVFVQTQCVGEWKRTYAVCSAHGLEGAYQHLCTLIRPVPHGEGLPEPPENFSMDSDENIGVSSNSEELQDMQTTCQAQTPPIIR